MALNETSNSSLLVVILRATHRLRNAKSYCGNPTPYNASICYCCIEPKETFYVLTIHSTP